MTTVSTKRRGDKKARTTFSEAPATAFFTTATESEVSQATTTEPEISEQVWRGASIAVLATAAALRLYAFALKPLHHDEGVNAFFLTRLFREGVYNYDPANYHGPTLYYFTLPPVLALGLNTFAIRLVPALFGLATVWLALCLRRRIGAVGALAAAALITVSPGAIYMSRYFIHEALFVFFTLGTVVAALRYYDTTRALYLMLAAASTALLFATKETAFISAGVLVLASGIAWGVAWVAQRLGLWSDEEKSEGEKSGRSGGRNPASKWRATADVGTLARFGGAPRVAFLLLAAIALFIFINVLFYSSFFTYAKGVEGALDTFQIWTETGNKDHTKAIYIYLWWIVQEESPLLLILGFVGALLAVVRAKDNFAIFAGAWAFGILAAYSIVPYKTPWLMLNFIIPLAIISGYGVELLYRWTARRTVHWRTLTLALMLAAIIVGAYQAIQLNFFHYDDDQYPYVYAHTRREFLDLVGEIERLAARTGAGKETAIYVASPDYWPLPWYLRDYKRVGFHSRTGATTDPIVVANETQEAELQRMLGASYQKIGNSYPLRPGVNLVIYARREVIEQ